jgi:GNAT superfamily N-acetyltransferase
VRIRPGTIHDAAALADLAARTFADTFERDNAAADMQAHLADAYGIAQQTAELTSPAVVTLLAEADDGLVAYAQLRRSAPPPCVQPADAIELHRFYVDRPAHGTGIAQCLMDAVRDAARAAGADHLWLGVWERNARALRFYAKCGFVDVGSHDFLLGTDRQTDRVMVAPVTDR